MNNQIEKIITQETQLGLTLQKFKKKYVYANIESQEAFYYDRFNPSPSQLIGFTTEEESKIKNLGCLMIIQAGIFLRLPITTTVSAQTIFHYFYQRVSLIHYDFRDVAMGAVFLAAQCEQTIRRSAHVALVFDQIFKIHQKSRRPTRIADIESKQFKAIQSKIIKMQTVILVQLGFEVYRILQTPHRYMNSILQMFSKHPHLQKIAQMSWGYLNDSYRTSLCLFYPGQLIAVSCIYLTLRKLDLSVGSVPWWCLFESNLEIMDNIVVDILAIYENRTDYYGAETIFNKISEKSQLNNVFPVPYYRKIANDERLETKQLQTKQTNHRHKEGRQRSRQKKHKKEKKNKRSQSRSQKIRSISKSPKKNQLNIPNKQQSQSKIQIFSSKIQSTEPLHLIKQSKTIGISEKIKELMDQKIDQKRQQPVQKQQQLDLEALVDASMMEQFRKKFVKNQNKEAFSSQSQKQQ